jgi:hypothetical protein
MVYLLGILVILQLVQIATGSIEQRRRAQSLIDDQKKANQTRADEMKKILEFEKAQLQFDHLMFGRDPGITREDIIQMKQTLGFNKSPRSVR